MVFIIHRDLNYYPWEIGDRLPQVEKVPTRLQNVENLNFHTPTPIGFTETKLSAEPGRLAEGEKTKLQRERSKHKLRLIISIIAAPLLVSIPFAIYHGHKFRVLSNKVDLDNPVERNTLKERIKRGDITFKKMSKSYFPDDVEKYHLFSKVDNTVKNRVYSKYRELYNGAILSQETKKEAKARIKGIFEHYTSEAISDYKWKRAGLIASSVLNVFSTIALVITAVMAADQDRPIDAAIRGALAVENAVDGVENLSNWERLSNEYDRKIGPWKEWKRNKYRNIDRAFEAAMDNQERLFREIFTSSFVQYTPESEPSDLLKVRPSAPPLSLMDEDEVDNTPSAPPADTVTPIRLRPTWEKGESGDIEIVCPISLMALEVDDKIVSLECGHVFSEDTIQEWYRNHDTCPCCRNKSVDKKTYEVTHERLLDVIRNCA